MSAGDNCRRKSKGQVKNFSETIGRVISFSFEGILHAPPVNEESGVLRGHRSCPQDRQTQSAVRLMLSSDFLARTPAPEPDSSGRHGLQ